MYSKKIVNFIAILLTIMMLFLTLWLKIKKHKIINYTDVFNKNMNLIITDSNTEIYNFTHNNNFYSLYHNDIVLLNIYDINDPKFLNGVSIAEYLSNKYQNISIYDIIIKEPNNELDVYSLIENNVENFIEKYGISRPIIYASKDILLDKLSLNNLKNKIIVLDENYHIKYTIDNNISTRKLEEILKSIKIHSKLSRTKNSDKQTFHNYNNSKSLIISMSKMIILDEVDGFNFPIFAVLDPSSKNIFLMKLDGEILYIVDCNNMCLPTSIKYSDSKLFITDSCEGSIKYFDFNDKKLKILIGNPNLEGISDFEYIDEENYLVSKFSQDTIGIFNNIEYITLKEKLNLDYNIDNVYKISKFNNKYYYFDGVKNILYSFDNYENKKEFSFNEIIQNEYGKINGFYINSENDIYFLDKNGHKILRLYNGEIIEDSFKDNIFSPNDFLIYKNIFFVLSDEYIQMFDIYHDNYSQIIPYCTNNTEYIGNILDNAIISRNSNIISRENFKIENILSYGETEVIKPSFLIFFEKKNGKLHLQKLLDYKEINSISLLDPEISYIFGKIYYIKNGKITVKYISYNLL